MSTNRDKKSQDGQMSHLRRVQKLAPEHNVQLKKGKSD